jgi:hypothetical protein
MSEPIGQEQFTQTVPESWQEVVGPTETIPVEPRARSPRFYRNSACALTLGALILWWPALLMIGTTLVRVSLLSYIPAFLVLVGAIAGVYFYPSAWAADRRHRNLLPIFLLNLFLGWTVLGWLGSLIWAVLNTGYSRPRLVTVVYSVITVAVAIAGGFWLLYLWWRVNGTRGY